MAKDFYPFVKPETGDANPAGSAVENQGLIAQFPATVAVYDDMLSVPHTITIEPKPVRDYLDELTNVVYGEMKKQGGKLSLMVIREIVENLFHAHFAEPVISVLDGGNTIRFADQGPGIKDKDQAFDFGFTSATTQMKQFIRGAGSGLPVVQEYLENRDGIISIEDNMGNGTVVTVTIDPKRSAEIEKTAARGAAIRGRTERKSEEKAVVPVSATPMAPIQAATLETTPAYLDARAKNVLEYLIEHEVCGPTELKNSFGSSLSTWTRTLQQLGDAGYVVKHGQKYQLTGFGRTYTSER